jgi:hypothetical protein
MEKIFILSHLTSVICPLESRSQTPIHCIDLWFISFSVSVLVIVVAADDLG